MLDPRDEICSYSEYDKCYFLDLGGAVLSINDSIWSKG